MGLLPYPPKFLTPTPRVCMGGLSYADVITKFSDIDRFHSLWVWG